MTHDEAAALQNDYGLKFPAAYLRAITDSYPFTEPKEELWDEPHLLRESNDYFRKEKPWGFAWEPHFWKIGGDGGGGFYFINSRETANDVYYVDHEAPARNIEDSENLSVTSFQEFIGEVFELEKEMQKFESEMTQSAANRKWWQFWIPRQWPPA